MKKIENSRPQQWQLLASPGHVLFARINAYRFKVRLPIALMSAALGIVYLSFALAPMLGSAAGKTVGWVTEKIGDVTAEKPLEPTPAPRVNEIQAVMPAVQLDVLAIPNLSDIGPEIKNQIELMKAGKQMTDCNFNSPINEPWTDGADFSPKCRYSADKKRLWIWAVVKKTQLDINPFLGLVATQKDGSVRFFNVRIARGAVLQEHDQIDQFDIPRAIAADFNELGVK